MYEIQYLKVLPGHANAFNEKMAEHNERFHGEGPYAASVFSVVNGPRSGQFLWSMGPTTWTHLDSRPSGEPHDPHWAQEVMSHAEAGMGEYWRMNDNLSTPLDPNAAPPPLLRVRYFEVADNGLFVKTQEQIEATVKAMGSTRTRIMYRKQFRHRDGRDWAQVSSYDNWAELDAPGLGAGGNFQRTFVEVHGLAAWSTFLEERGAAVVGSEEEWLQLVP
jgi:hypothetical protein